MALLLSESVNINDSKACRPLFAKIVINVSTRLKSSSLIHFRCPRALKKENRHDYIAMSLCVCVLFWRERERVRMLYIYEKYFKKSSKILLDPFTNQSLSPIQCFKN